MRRRNKLTIILTFPSVALLWLIGWSLYWTGSTRKTLKRIRKVTATTEPTFTVAILEEEIGNTQN